MGGAMARMGEFRTEFWWKNIKEDLKNLGAGRRIMLKYIFQKDSPDTRLRPLYGFCIYSNEHSGFIKCGEFLD
jgi:hypothetical protein